jgi:hypothetical protein
MKDFLDSVSDAIGSMSDVLYREAVSAPIESVSSRIVSANRRVETENPRIVTAQRPFTAATRHSHAGDLDVQCASDARVSRSPHIMDLSRANGSTERELESRHASASTVEASP